MQKFFFGYSTMCLGYSSIRVGIRPTQGFAYSGGSQWVKVAPVKPLNGRRGSPAQKDAEQMNISWPAARKRNIQQCFAE